MIGGESDAPPPNGGEFLLRLLKNPHQYSSQLQQSQLLTDDPAVTEFGPSFPMPFVQNSQRDVLRHALPENIGPPPQAQPPPPSAPHQYFRKSRDSNPEQRNNVSNFASNQQEQQGLVFGSFKDKDGSNNGFSNESPLISRQGYFNRGSNGLEVQGYHSNSPEFERDKHWNSVDSRVHVQDQQWDRNGHKKPHSLVDSRVHVQEGMNYSRGHTELYSKVPTAFHGVDVKQNIGYTNRRVFEQNRASGSTKFRNSRYQSGKNVSENQSFSDKHKNARWEERKVDNKHNHPVSLQVSTSRSVSASSALELGGQDTENLEIRGKGSSETERTSDIDLDNLKEQLEDTLRVGDEVEEKTEQSKHHRTRDKEYRSDKRGQSIMGQKVRYMKRQLVCRGDIELWNIPFVTIYESLIPAEEEKVKQKQLLSLLENIVSKEWAGSGLYLYGSCANSFGFSKSDLDVCLTIDDDCMSKSDILLRLADLLRSENLENVQALTRARVPIVKLMDPTTGISCDICVNNVLAVVNTKLLRDYAVIDVRLRQLAFLVKHWAKSRGVNETYQGTLSSYAYVLMCIHFLQLRRPAILPCLQEMTATYSVTVNNVDCAFFDRVETLGGYGSHNRESISRLLWEFFHYWAYCHDYINDVISIRTGQFLSKKYKDWTRRIGNDRHLICIEDPFELSYDLGRVVDKKSIKVLIEEFERAAQIMQFDPNPCVTLFEPYIPS